MRSSRFNQIMFGIFVCVVALIFCGAIPRTINYQGKLIDSSGVGINDTLNMEFKLYDAESGGNLLWRKTLAGVPITNGLFSVILGESDGFDTLSFARQYWLEVKIGDEVLTPREKLVAVPYALRAGTADNSWWANSGDNIYNVNTGKVGIGTSSPSTKLQVVGTTRSSGFSAADGTAGSPSYYFASDGDVGMFRPGTNMLAFTTGGTERLRITETGNVGIGTTTPEAMLHVAGTIMASHPDFPDDISYITANGTNSLIGGGLMVNGDVDINMASPFGGWTITGVDGDGDDFSLRYTGINPCFIIEGQAPDVPSFYIKDNGNVGLGTTTPQERLDSNGNIRATGQIYSQLYTIPWPSR